MAKKRKTPAQPGQDWNAPAAELLAELPTDRDELRAAAVAAVVEIDAAIMRGDGAAAEAASDRYEAVIWKMNGGTHVGSMADHDAPGQVIERHCAAVPGDVPLWGQRGQFLVADGDMRALVEYEAGYGGPLGAHFQFHVIDLDRPFISETGYRSHFDTAQGCMTVDEVARGILAAQRAEKKRPVMVEASYRDRLADAPLPAWLAGLEPPARREPATVLVPPGFVLVDVVLPSHRAFIARRWAAEAATRIKAARAAGLDAKGKITGAGPERDPASPETTMTCSIVKADDAERGSRPQTGGDAARPGEPVPVHHGGVGTEVRLRVVDGRGLAVEETGDRDVPVLVVEAGEQPAHERRRVEDRGFGRRETGGVIRAGGVGCGAGEDDGQVGDCQHHRRHRRHTRSEYARYVGVGGDHGVDRVGGHRHRGAADQQRPGIPGRLLAGEGDDGDGGDDDDAVHDQRPRPRLLCTDAASGREVCQRGEGQPERAGGDEHRPRHRRHHRPSATRRPARDRAARGRGGHHSPRTLDVPVAALASRRNQPSATCGDAPRTGGDDGPCRAGSPRTVR